MDAISALVVARFHHLGRCVLRIAATSEMRLRRVRDTCRMRHVWWLASSISALMFGSFAAHADVDLSGSWAQKIHEDFVERVVGPALGDFTGLPLNSAARLRGRGWNDQHWSVPEHQCEAAPATYAPHGPGSMRVWSEVNGKTQQLIAWHVVYLWHTPHRVIWMDGRSHPPEGAQHTWMGFSTGKWLGDTLVVTTTHLKSGWIRRNGVPHSDRASLTEYWMRHGNYLTVVSVLDDPAYLTAPLVRSSTWTLALGYKIGGYSCSVSAENELPRGFVAHDLTQNEAALHEFASARRLPLHALSGGEQKLYPEYAHHIVAQPSTIDGAPLPRRPDQGDGREEARDEPDSLRAAGSKRAANTRILGIKSLQIRANVFVLMSSTGNTTVQVGDEGILVVDTQRADLHDELIDELQRLSTKPIRHVINTSADSDNSGGNEWVGMAGRSIGPEAAFFDREANSASIYAHENVLRAMSKRAGETTARVTAAWPTDVYFTEWTDLYFNGEAIELRHMQSAHSDGDTIVYLRRSDVVSAGNIFLTTGYPIVDLASGGSIDGVIEALNRVIDITIPESGQEGGTLVIPGRGRICDEHDVVAYRDMITIIRDHVRHMIRQGMTLEEIHAARPTQAYDVRYATEPDSVTPSAFVEAIYASLTKGDGP